ncbi:MAG: hypothetical protein ACLFVP_04310 [Candidatus Bathyarchaeia archaeon]
MDDIDVVIERFRGELSPQEEERVMLLRKRLDDLNHLNKVKINHSVMELICAKYLIKDGFNVELEYTVNDVSTDVYAEKGYGSLIVEVETGFVPPEHALDPQTYLKARIASKITRYSGYANKFVLASTPYYIMQIPASLTKPPRFRNTDEVDIIKKLCDLYYSNPPVSLEEIRNARLHSIYVVDVDNAKIREWEINEYMGKAALWTI